MLRNLLLAVAVGVAAIGNTTPPDASASPRGLVGMGCRIVEVYDGDTITVEVKVRARVRLLDCWAPEIRTRSANEKIAGRASRDHLAEHCGMSWNGSRWVGSTPAWLSIPLPALPGEAIEIADLITLGRVLGAVSIDGETTLAEHQVLHGHAVATQGEQRARREEWAKPDK